MRNHSFYATSVALALLLTIGLRAVSADAPPDYTRWKNGPSTAADFFPLSVWLQGPHNAAKYKAIGVNLFIGLWDGPTEEQLAALTKAEMPVICNQNDVGLKSPNSKIIVGWMHGDEPDNAQALPGNKGYGPPIEPQKIVADYERIRAADPTRPVFLNLGQGVAYDEYIGRGTRCNKPEDYPEYLKGGDVASFDIYPTSHDSKEVQGNLWYVPRGVERLRKGSNDAKPIWCCIETTQIAAPGKQPTPHAVRAEVWMALIHGARGIIYFAHEFKPRFLEAGLFAHPEIVEALKNINAEVKSLAPALNAPTLPDAVKITQEKDAAPVAFVVKKDANGVYIFAVNMRGTDTKATFALKETAGAGSSVEALGEKRSIPLTERAFSDDFKAYDVHLYRVAQ